MFVIYIVEACDKKTIPTVTHATYIVSEETTSGNFTLPDRVNVTYTCNEGYTLLYPQNFTVGCEYITTPRGEHGNVLAKAVWTSPDGIICKLGEYIDGTYCNPKIVSY